MNQYDTAIPGKKYIFGLRPFSGTELLKNSRISCAESGEGIFCHVNE